MYSISLSDKIKRCPCCGNQYPTEIRDNNTVYVHCDYCGFKTKEYHYTDKQKAIDEWNNSDSPWHTGTPTITGLYVVKFKDGGYDVILYDNGKVFEGDDPLCGWDIYSDEKPEDIIKWQLLEKVGK